MPETRRYDGSDGVLMNTFEARKAATYQLFNIKTFSRFSSSRFLEDLNGEAPTPADTQSVEAIHNTIHNVLGSGGGGHMISPGVAAFDPIFYLHHCNVDRLMALYQAIFPESSAGSRAIVQPLDAQFGTFTRPQLSNENVDTPLTPFRHTNGGDWTSRDVSSAKSIYQLGYAYPEVPADFASRSDSELADFTRRAVDALYSPQDLEETASLPGETQVSAFMAMDSNTTSKSGITTPVEAGTKKRVEWLATVIFDESEIDGSFTVWLFVGEEPSGSGDQVLMTKSLVGGCSSFSSKKMSKRSVISGAIPLTRALTVEGVTLDPKDAATYLKDNLHWRIMKGSEQLDTSALPSLQVQVNAAEVEYSDDPTILPVYGEWRSYYEATAQKAGGTTIENNSPLLSEDIAAVNSTVAVRYRRVRRY